MPNRTIMQRRLAMLAAVSLAGSGSPLRRPWPAATATSARDRTAAPAPLPGAPAPAPAPSPADTQGEQATNGGGTEVVTKSRTTRPVVIQEHDADRQRRHHDPSGGVQGGASGTSLSPATPSTAIGPAGARSCSS